MFVSSYHHEIFRSYYHWQKWCPCKRSRSQQCRRKTCMVHQTFVWWALCIPYKFVKSSIRHLGLAIWMFDVSDVFRLHCTKVITPLNRFRTITQFEVTYGDEMMHKAWCCLEEVPYCFSRSCVKFQGHTAKKKSILTQIGRFRTVTLVSTMPTKSCTTLEAA